MMFKMYIQYMKERLYDNKKLISFIVFFLIFVFSYIYFFTYIHIGVELKTDSNGVFQIFWAWKYQDYNENMSYKFRIRTTKDKYNFSITNLKSFKTLKSIRRLRIDPIKTYPSEVIIKSIVIKQIGYKPLRFETSAELEQLAPLKDIQRIENRQSGLEIVTSGEDPQLEVLVDPTIDYKLIIIVFLSCVIFGYIWSFIFGYIDNRGERFRYVPYLMVFVLTLLFIAGSICNTMHADEGVHASAAGYYEDHWLPPEICAPGTEHAYSPYGTSRLNRYEIVYFIAGKFSRLLSFIPLDERFRLRLFNVFLYFILLILCIRNVEYRILSIPLLLSPQIWYAFSYFNSDAFSLFILLIISYQVLSKNSFMSRFLEESGGKEIFVHAIILGLVFSLLLLIKKNYYFFIIFLLFYFMLKLFTKDFNNTKIAVKRIAMVILVAVSVFGLRYSVDIYINGFDKTEKLLECREKMASPKYKPSTRLEKKFPYLKLRDRGISIKNMFVKHNWGIISFSSAFGVYYIVPVAPKAYYKIIIITFIMFGLYIIFSFFFKQGFRDNMLLLLVFVCSFLLVSTSFWHSWNNDFQAQGRYLFPIFSMLGFLLFRSVKYLNKQFLNFFIILMFVMSAYSFIFVALLKLPKIY